MVRRWRLFGNFLRPAFSASRMQHISDMHVRTIRPRHMWKYGRHPILWPLRLSKKKDRLEMWANAQRDGRPAEYRWHPLFNAAKFGWRPLLEWRAVTLSRRETRWNLHGCPKLANRSQPLYGPKFTILWGTCVEILLLNKFFRLLIRTLVAKI